MGADTAGVSGEMGADKKFSFLKKCIGVELIYNVALVSGVQQSDSVIRIYTYSFSDSFPL